MPFFGIFFDRSAINRCRSYSGRSSHVNTGNAPKAEPLQRCSIDFTALSLTNNTQPQLKSWAAFMTTRRQCVDICASCSSLGPELLLLLLALSYDQQAKQTEINKEKRDKRPWNFLRWPIVRMCLLFTFASIVPRRRCSSVKYRNNGHIYFPNTLLSL